MEKKYVATENTQLDIKGLQQDIKADVSAIKSGVQTLKAGILPHITLTAPTGCTVTAQNGGTTLAPTETGATGVFEFDVPNFGKWKIAISATGEAPVEQTVNVNSLTVYETSMSFFEATITVKTPVGTELTLSGGEITPTQTKTSTGSDSFTVKEAATFLITAVRDDNTKLANVVVSEATTYSVTVKGLIRYGFKVAKADSNPATRVTYLYDAEGKTPAHMDYGNSKFEYGDWADAWFIKDNKPLMLKSNGTVDYYLDPADYTKKADGTASDITNTSYDGNGMAQFPETWVRRYEDTDYEYTIVSDGQVDENYKAYAHTDADGNVRPYFYWSLFIGHLVGSKLRSLKGNAPLASKTAAEEIGYAQANGSLWYTGTWSRYALICDLCVLISKTTNLQTAFGNGFHQGSGTSVNNTGTLSDKGQFFGYNDATHTVKRFHCEFESGQWLRLAGCIYNDGKLYIKMTPEGDGYRVTDVTGMTDTGITIGGTSGGYISAMQNGDTGRLPKTASGSETTYWCDGCWYNAGQLDYLVVGGNSADATGFGGAFTFHVAYAPSYAGWHIGAGLSCDMPPAA